MTRTPQCGASGHTLRSNRLGYCRPSLLDLRIATHTIACYHAGNNT